MLSRKRKTSQPEHREDREHPGQGRGQPKAELGVASQPFPVVQECAIGRRMLVVVEPVLKGLSERGVTGLKPALELIVPQGLTPKASEAEAGSHHQDPGKHEYHRSAERRGRRTGGSRCGHLPQETITP
jgi:hypothetical protein